MQKEQKLVADLTKAWEEKDEWLTPCLTDSIDFVVTEAVEALEARLRMNPEYVRNHPAVTSLTDVAEELVDTIFQAFVTLNLMGADAQSLFLDKLYEMDGKRLAAGRDVLYEYVKRQ
jgi:predicted HAD superfamily Cof-like phosphohydrolase